MRLTCTVLQVLRHKHDLDDADHDPQHLLPPALDLAFAGQGGGGRVAPAADANTSTPTSAGQERTLLMPPPALVAEETAEGCASGREGCKCREGSGGIHTDEGSCRGGELDGEAAHGTASSDGEAHGAMETGPAESLARALAEVRVFEVSDAELRYKKAAIDAIRSRLAAPPPPPPEPLKHERRRSKDFTREFEAFAAAAAAHATAAGRPKSANAALASH